MGGDRESMEDRRNRMRGSHLQHLEKESFSQEISRPRTLTNYPGF